MIIYKEKDTKNVHPIDLPGWLEQGWSLNPQDSKLPEGSFQRLTNDEITALDQRVAELKNLHWSQLKKLADGLALAKPDDVSWEDFASTVANAEV